MNDSELIISPNGTVYHLPIKEDQLTDIILTVGDPERVHLVARYLDKIHFHASHREFSVVGGMLHSHRVLVLSTGMGTDNIEIALNELDILANVDHKSRKVRDKHRKLYIIRLGTSGSLNEEIPPGGIVYSEVAAGFDLLSVYYGIPQEWKIPTEKINSLLEPVGLRTYFTQCGAGLRDHFSSIFPSAFTLTLPGFYAPQGRNIRLHAQVPQLLDLYKNLEVNHRFPDNLEMETAGYYLLGKWMGHECISINAILANRISGEFHSDPNSVVEEMIESVIKSLKSFEVN